jgi:hypothetical protein
MKKGSGPICRNGPPGASHRWGLTPFSLPHPAKNRLQVASFGDVCQERMIGPRPGDLQDLDAAAGLPGRPPERLQKHLLRYQPRARTGQKNAAGRHRLQGELVHVEVAFEGVVDLLAVAGLLGGIEDDDVETFAVGQRLAEPGKQVGLDEADPCLVQIGILLGQGDDLLVEIDPDDLPGGAGDLGTDSEAAGIAAQI